MHLFKERLVFIHGSIHTCSCAPRIAAQSSQTSSSLRCSSLGFTLVHSPFRVPSHLLAISFCTSAERDLRVRRRPRFAFSRCCCSAEFLHIFNGRRVFHRLPFQPLLHLPLISALKSYFRLLPSAQCACRRSKPALWLGNQIGAVAGGYRQAEHHRKAHYQYFF